MTDPNDRQVGGDHYRTGYQPWDYFEDWGIGYLECNVIKYVARWRKKDGVKDIQKGIHYTDKLIERAEQLGRCAKANVPDHAFQVFVDGLSLNHIEKMIVRRISKWSSIADLKHVRDQLVVLTQEHHRETAAMADEHFNGGDDGC